MSLHFKTVRWKNFLSTGDVFTEINLDQNKTTLIVGENGAGKSTMLDAICFGLFGKPYRKINKPQLVNSVNQKGTLVEIEFRTGKKEYLVRRGLKPNVFEVFCNGKLVDQNASVKDYQEFLEKSILKSTLNSFTQIEIIGSSSFVPFMQLPTGQRREIIEEILDIKIFSAMNLLLKDKIQANKDRLNDIKYSIELIEEKITINKKYISDIENNKRLQDTKKKQELSKTRTSIENFKKEEDELREKITTVENELTHYVKFKKRLDKILNYESDFEKRISKYKKEMSFYDHTETCPTCQQGIDASFRKMKVEELKESIKKLEVGLEKLEVELVTTNENLEKLKTLQERRKKLHDKLNSVLGDIRSLTLYLDKLNEEKSVGVDVKDYENALLELESSKRVQEKYREDALNEKEFLDAAGDLLKDKGIKTQIIKQYVPIMNKLINKYLTAMEFFVNFELDENFNEIIKSRHRDEFSYASFSEGEKMRIDLALMLTWRSIAKMKNSNNSNLLILDEVFDASLDTNACEEFLKLLHQLGENTNIFVVSHKGDILNDKFENVIRFEKRKNFSMIGD